MAHINGMEQCKTIMNMQVPVHIKSAYANPVEDQIRRLAASYGVDEDRAVDIARCESQLGKYKTNWSGSSAKGVYQFIDKTWQNYCEGDVMDDEDNIRCFMEQYPKHPSWWECNRRV